MAQEDWPRGTMSLGEAESFRFAVKFVRCRCCWEIWKLESGCAWMMTRQRLCGSLCLLGSTHGGCCLCCVKMKCGSSAEMASEAVDVKGGEWSARVERMRSGTGSRVHERTETTGQISSSSLVLDHHHREGLVTAPVAKLLPRLPGFF
jgi:hypothetical protein